MLDKSPENDIPSKEAIQLVRDTAFRLLARREHSQSELVRKLTQKGFSPEVCHQVVQQLATDGYQSQRRFTEMWIKSRAAKYYGENKIRSELAQHQIAQALINELLNEVDVDWFELCLQSYQKKYSYRNNFSSNSGDDWAAKQKQKRYLWTKGFTEEQIAYALDAAEQESGF